MPGKLTKAETEVILANSFFGRIGFRDQEKMHIVPVSFVYDHDSVLCQSYEGVKVSMMRLHPEVCFEVEVLHSFDSWKTVNGWGTFEELTQAEDIIRAREQLSETLLAKKARLSSPPRSEKGGIDRGNFPAMLVYYRIWFSELTGRFEKAF